MCERSVNVQCRAPLQFEDIWELPSDDKVGHLANRFRPIWKEQLARRGGPSLVRQLCEFYVVEFESLLLLVIERCFPDLHSCPMDSRSCGLCLRLKLCVVLEV